MKINFEHEDAWNMDGELARAISSGIEKFIEVHTEEHGDAPYAWEYPCTKENLTQLADYFGSYYKDGESCPGYEGSFPEMWARLGIVFPCLWT